jgi:hypothetical protein
MENNKRISEILVETGAYTDLERPVMLTSGELGIYYINTEKLAQDGGKFNEFGDDSAAMIGHAVRMMQINPTFNESIEILTDKVARLFPNTNFENCAVSGGQRRDWLFSGPVALKLGIPHVSLYKEGQIEIVNPSGAVEDYPINSLCVVHLVDLITEGSSVYTKTKEGEEKGWVPMLREIGAEINDLVAVVTRQQGGEEMLKEQRVTVHPFVAIDEAFLMQYSKNPERAVAYLKDPKAWSEAYLRENGALALIGDFDPNGKKLDRAKKFMQRYGSVLEGSRMVELEAAVLSKYGKSVSEIIGGN